MSTPSLSKSASTESFSNATLLSEGSSYRPSTGIKLVSKDGSISHAVHADDSDYAALELYRQEFSKSQAKLQSSDAESPRSACALCLQFIQFLLNKEASKLLVDACFQSFERDVLGPEDIHSLLRDLEKTPVVRKQALRTFYAVRSPGSSLCGEESALMKAAESGQASLLVLFGGQSIENPKCVSRLKDLYSQYPTLLDELTTVADTLLSSLSRLPATRDYYRHRNIDLRLWLENASKTPDQDTLGTAAFSFPIIGLIGLAHYCITAKILNKTPGDLRQILRGTSGHSQGIAVAACIAYSDSWKSFYENSKLFLELLFWTGFESHLAAPRSSLSATAIADSLDHGEGRPSSLLSVRGLDCRQLQSVVDQCNDGLTVSEMVYIALINDDDNLVVAGPAKSLRGLNLHLRSLKDGGDQSRTPFSQRKALQSHFFLPVSAPFHTPYLQEASAAVKQHMQGWIIPSIELKIPVYHSATGLDIRQMNKWDVVATIIDAIMVKTVNWPLTLNVADVSHIVVFGGGRLVDLAARYKEGQNVRIIAGCELETSNDLVGSKGELFARDMRDNVLYPQSWAQTFGPRMIESYSSPHRLETKLSRLLGTPPIMVAGMTPTTVHSDVVSAIMNAGYHVELAGGGYLNAGAMEEAINRVVDAVPPGRGVTCNVIYSSPKAIGWQIPMIRRLIKQGVPIDGVTIGAGVPSPEIITEYATTLGLKHISFKPGSSTAIKQVIEAARSHPTFPVILQWTGGRGGGHHSFEDFHTPILKTYGEIRRCPNIILVAGSGFGDAQGIHPYITGSWAYQFGRPAMPFDGILLGSRMMVAKEAHTSRAAKEVIVSTAGGSDWEKSYAGSVGGIVTVKSEMGQPIHKIATRGVQLWAEFDKHLFCLTKDKRLAELKRKRQSIIRRLNEDFAKPWFGRNRFGDVVDLDDMTYYEVLQRLVELMYVRRQNRWIDESYATLVQDFCIRTLERLGDQRMINLDLRVDSPLVLIEAMQTACPAYATQLLHPEDVAFFLGRCRIGGQKPVNFIPVLDENFETWFKKDSLWQSEDLDAVVDQDPGRVCILHGPAAAKYSRRSNESAKTILDDIHARLVDLLRNGDVSEHEDPVELSREPSGSSEALGWATRPSAWMNAIMNEEYVLQGSKRIPNPIRRLLGSWSGGIMKVKYFGSSLQLSYQRGEEIQIAAKLHSANGRHISVDLFHSNNEESKPCALNLAYQYNPEVPGKISEVTVERNSRIQAFYQSLWCTQNQSLNANRSIRSTFYGDEVLLDKGLLQDMTLTISAANADLGHSMSTSFPIDICIKLAWGVLIQPLLSREIDCDLLKLVHQSNTFEYCSNATPLKVGDTISSSSRVIAVRIIEAGKTVVVKATIVRSGEAVANVTSEFLIKGTFVDFENTFEERKEPMMEMHIASEVDEMILKSRDWISIENGDLSLVGKTILFSITTSIRGKAKSPYNTLRVEGDIHEKQSGNYSRQIGRCTFSADDCKGNPLADFLERRGRPASPGVSLQRPGWSNASSSIDISIPASNESYAKFSSDFNPIHISPLFASWAELPGTITHGMFTSAVSRAVAEHFLDDIFRTRFRSYKTKFTGMVLPGDEITVSVEHTAMIEGRLLITITVANKTTGDKVMEGEAEVEQDGTMYVFTGQGSQEQNMGMALYESSVAARSVWDSADKHLRERFGKILSRRISQSPLMQIDRMVNIRHRPSKSKNFNHSFSW